MALHLQITITQHFFPPLFVPILALDKNSSRASVALRTLLKEVS